MPSTLDWKAVLWAGIVAGIVFMMVEMLLVWQVQGDSPWAPPRMIAAMVMGRDVLPPPAPFDGAVMAVAMAIHMILSILLAVIFGWAISRFRLSMTASIIAGTLFGIAVYAINFYGFTAVFPWFAMARGAISIFAHAVFGAVLGGVYRAVAGRPVARHPRAAEA